ncbi:hypothetical protein WN55_06747 [Dufourea novaeangliae]|uniref:Uncharacterized protein n=1 Tax=Dufourea novaeangliae TaxID=178035 RepID=A0A154PQS4_DUFNO|nr:hypothetical protein WN55_06747 [Dufourea novaeangliae]
MVTGPYVISDSTPIFYYYTATARLEIEALTDIVLTQCQYGSSSRASPDITTQ